jgi:hypothetical protein
MADVDAVLERLEFAIAERDDEIARLRAEVDRVLPEPIEQSPTEQSPTEQAPTESLGNDG